MIYELLDVNHHPENKKYVPFFFTVFIFIFLSNILSNVPGCLPINSLLIVSIPINMCLVVYYLYASIRSNGFGVINIFFNPTMVLPLRIFLGLMEIIALFSKIFTFSIRLLANLTAGHVLMWVIETFVIKAPFVIKTFPFMFLVLIYIIEILFAFLQSYIFILLSVNVFKNIQHAH